MIKKIAFLGTPGISRSTLRFLVESGYEVPVVVTGADKKRGRGSRLTPSPIKELAEELGLRVGHDPRALLEIDFDLAVVVAYGRLISDALLSKGLFVNLHFSLLPRWRGAAPMERAILAGDTETGVCVMKLVKDLDAGPIFQVRRLPLDDEITLEELAGELSKLANEALDAELSLGEEAFKSSVEQVGEPTYAHKLTAGDLRIDWSAPSSEILRKVRLGMAWTTLDGSRFKIIAAGRISNGEAGLGPGWISGIHAGTGDGVIELRSVQPENKRRMEAKEWMHGMKHLEDLHFI